MAFHHVALATRDLEATHGFYTGAMGFSLVKVVAAPTPEGGWARHVFYDTGNGEMIAFWDLHVDSLSGFPTDLNKSLGLPAWVNHLAFDAPDLETLAACRRRWLDHDLTVMEVDHGFCTSVYTIDPNGIMVEFCCTTRDFTADELAWATANVLAPTPELERPPDAVVHRPGRAPAAVAAPA